MTTVYDVHENRHVTGALFFYLADAKRHGEASVTDALYGLEWRQDRDLVGHFVLYARYRPLPEGVTVDPPAPEWYNTSVVIRPREVQ